MKVARLSPGSATLVLAATSLTNPLPFTAGKAAVVFAATNSGTSTTHTLTDSRGNAIPAPVTFAGIGAMRLSIWVFPNIAKAGAGLLTLTPSRKSDIFLHAVDYEGLDLAGALDGTPVVAGAQSLSIALPPFTTSLNGSLGILAFFNQSSSQEDRRVSEAAFREIAFVPSGVSDTSWMLDAAGLPAGTYAVTCAGASAASDNLGAILLAIKAAQGPFIATHPVNQNVRAANEQAVFSVTARAASGALSYQWLCNGEPIPGATGAVYIVAPLSWKNSGDVYSCIVMDGSGASRSEGAYLWVSGLPGRGLFRYSR